MKKQTITNTPIKSFIHLFMSPLLLMVGFYITHLIFQKSSFFKKYIPVTPNVVLVEQSVLNFVLFGCAYWFLVRLINKSRVVLEGKFIEHPVLKIVLPLFVVVVKTLAFLSLFNILVQSLEIPSALSLVLTKITSVFIIVAISWILFKVVDVGDQYLLQRYLPKKGTTVAARKIYTHSLILKRFLYGLIVVLSLGAILMLFDNVRAIGASVLTTAGVMGLVITFTAQKSLTSILSGVELALTQPIKIGDEVVINNEMGTVEEINFRSVVIKLWDWRRLVVPTNYFLENIFQNWSRDQDNNLIGIVTLYTDFTLPVARIREELKAILSSSPLWDEKVGNLTVSDLQQQVMQLRVLASAKNAKDVSALKNEIREKLIHFITIYYPDSLPRTRSYSVDRQTKIMDKNSQALQV